MYGFNDKLQNVSVLPSHYFVTLKVKYDLKYFSARYIFLVMAIEGEYQTMIDNAGISIDILNIKIIYYTIQRNT